MFRSSVSNHPMYFLKMTVASPLRPQKRPVSSNPRTIPFIFDTTKTFRKRLKKNLEEQTDKQTTGASLGPWDGQIKSDNNNGRFCTQQNKMTYVRHIYKMMMVYKA